ncbi:MAG: elongation factor P [Chloroflexi bacterium]|uniref:Elongation factor P n=1 Tax=Candidatus Chlorohelix allophototropha TaxID=3003348 RepID=A0A8T7LZG4_9CHLR|nr:elongation factor P [Chloroflexota bacterium]WJW66683.1 elongation factor P [Chloroflexota bacterium L227-S17]
MVSTSEIKRGMVIDLDGQLQKILEFDHQKIGRGSAQVKISFKNLRSGSNTVRTFQAGAKFNDVRLEREVVQFLYKDGDDYHFMNVDNYEQSILNDEQMGDVKYYIHENDTVDLITYNSEPIDIEIPPSVVLTVTYTEPGIRGDTASGTSKPATTDTGLTVNVPLFINIGDKVKVDTRSGSYVERA